MKVLKWCKVFCNQRLIGYWSRFKSFSLWNFHLKTFCTRKTSNIELRIKCKKGWIRVVWKLILCFVFNFHDWFWNVEFCIMEFRYNTISLFSKIFRNIWISVYFSYCTFFQKFFKMLLVTIERRRMVYSTIFFILLSVT